MLTYLQLENLKERIEEESEKKEQQESEKKQNESEQQAERQTSELEMSEEEKHEQREIDAMLRRIPDDPGGLLRAKFRNRENSNDHHLTKSAGK